MDKRNRVFITEYTPDGCLRLLQHKEDVYQMNWADGDIPWGTVTAPEGIAVIRSHTFKEEVLEEKFSFTNTSAFPIYFTENSLGIYVSLPDRYTEAGECMTRCCHTHLWCGKEAAWIMALRMGGQGQNLGLAVRQGGILSYSVRRNPEKLSNDRGSFLLHPDVDCIYPGESYIVRWELFWFENREDFRQKLLSRENMPVLKMEQCTYFAGETAVFHIEGKGNPTRVMVTCAGREVKWKKEILGASYCIEVEEKLEAPGEYPFDIEIDGVRTYARLKCCSSLERLLENRCRFIACKQQETWGSLRGAYLIFDNETGRRYYSHQDDHNGGRERLGMGALIALWLQEKKDDFLEKSLEQYLDYVYRELFDSETGDVFNDINKNHDWDRLYNYPWMASFFMEVYKWKKDTRYLKDAWKAMQRYYSKGGKDFYAIGLPGTELMELLRQAGLVREAEMFAGNFLEHVRAIMDTGLNFPKSEVNYEQSIVAPAVSALLQGYELVGDKKFLAGAEKMLGVLELFNGQQPDYHMYENAIRHWDGYWFGKRRCLGDTFPHYWSVLTGVEYIRYGKLTRRGEYIRRGRASLRGCLTLFGEDGSASCAMVYPASVNGMPGHYYDPWANDQDWALYYAWKMKQRLSDTDDENKEAL